MSIDNGASACYVHGGAADRFVKQGRIDEIHEAVEFIKQNGLPAGIGAHKISTIKGCVDYGLNPDYWMKTLHLKDYLKGKEEDMYKNIFL